MRSSMTCLRCRMVSVTISSSASTSASSRCTSAFGITPTVRPPRARAPVGHRAHRRDVAAAGHQRPAAVGDRLADAGGPGRAVRDAGGPTRSRRTPPTRRVGCGCTPRNLAETQRSRFAAIALPVRAREIKSGLCRFGGQRCRASHPWTARSKNSTDTAGSPCSARTASARRRWPSRSPSELGEKSPVRVIGTATQAGVPFGAFGTLVEVAEVGKPAALIRSALDSLLAQADNAVIVVDDAHLLDPLSATLVYQLAQQPGVRLIVTARSTSPLPGAVAALWEDGLLGRVDVALMDGGGDRRRAGRPARADHRRPAVSAQRRQSAASAAAGRIGRLRRPLTGGVARRPAGRADGTGARGAGLPGRPRAVVADRPGRL